MVIIGGEIQSFDLSITSLDPPVLIENRPVHVAFSLTNRFGTDPTSGVVTATSGGQYQVARIRQGATITGVLSTIAPRAGKGVQFVLQYYDKDAPIVAEIRQPSAEASINVDIAAKYMLSLDSFHIEHTRSPHQDTDYVSIGGQLWWDPGVPPNKDSQTATAIHNMGDVNDGDYLVNLQVGPFTIGPDDRLAIDYQITNTGYLATHQEGAKQVSDLISEATHAVLDAVYPEFAGVWQIADDFTHRLNAILATNCDGLVAADKVIKTGAVLDQLTSSTSSHSEKKQFVRASPTFCGSHDQDYTVTWSVTRLAQG